MERRKKTLKIILIIMSCVMYAFEYALFNHVNSYFYEYININRLFETCNCSIMDSIYNCDWEIIMPLFIPQTAKMYECISRCHQSNKWMYCNLVYPTIVVQYEIMISNFTEIQKNSSFKQEKKMQSKIYALTHMELCYQSNRSLKTISSNFPEKKYDKKVVRIKSE